MKTKLLFATLAAGLLASQPAFAASYTFTPPAAGTAAVNWSAGTFWDATPVSGIDTQLIFGGALDAATTVVSNDDIASPPFQLNNLTYNASGPASGTAPTYTIQGTQLQFVTSSGAVTPTLTLSATGTVKPTLAISNALLLTNDLTISATTNATLSGVISGASNLAISGGGLVVLSNTGNTFGGANKTITVSGGSVLRTNSNSSFGGLGSTSNKLVLNGGGFEFAPSASVSVTFDRAIEFQNGGTNTLKDGAGGSSNRHFFIAGVLSGNGGFTNAGAATGLNLVIGNNASSTLSGTVTAATNTIYVNANGTTDGLGAAAIELNGGNFVFGGSSGTPTITFNRGIAVNSANSLSVTNNFTFTHTGALTGASTLTINNGTTQSGLGTVTAVNASGAGSVINLNGDLSGFSGGLTVSNGTLRFGTGATLPPSFGLLTLANTSGVLADLNGRSITVKGLATGGATGGNIQGNSTGSANTLTTDTTAGSQSYSGVISDGGSVALNVTKIGTNTQTLGGGNTYSGLTTISAGTLILSGSNTGAGGVALTSGTLTLGAAGTTGSLNTASTITYGSGVTLAFNRSNAVAQGTDFSGAAIGGSVNIEQKGTSASTVTLNAANTYTGTTTVTTGKLAAGIASVAGVSGAFGLNSAVTTANTAGAVLDITGGLPKQVQQWLG